MHHVGHDVVEQPLVVRHHNGRFVRAVQGVDPVGNHAQCVDVEAGVGLVENGEPGFQDRQLQNFMAFFFSAGKALVDRAIEKFFVHLDQFEFVPNQGEKVKRIDLVFCSGFANGVEGCPQKVRAVHAGDFHWILKREKHALRRAFIRGHVEQVFALIDDVARRDAIRFVPREHLRQRALARSVGPHNGVGFARIDHEIDAVQNLRTLHTCMQIPNFQHVFIPHCFFSSAFMTDAVSEQSRYQPAMDPNS